MIAFDVTLPFMVQPKQTKGNRSVQRPDGTSYTARYTPTKVKNNAASLALLLAEKTNARNLSGPLRVRLDFRYPWRSTEPQKRRKNGFRPKDTKPDLDNLTKQTLDAMQSALIFVNDAQVADLRVSKEWSDDPGLRILVETMED